MSLLADIKNYWENNGALMALVPVQYVFFGVVPENLPLPYVTIQNVSVDEIHPDTVGNYLETVHFEISLFNNSQPSVDWLADQVKPQFFATTVTPNCIGSWLEQETYTAEEHSQPNRYVYCANLRFRLLLQNQFVQPT